MRRYYTPKHPSRRQIRSGMSNRQKGGTRNSSFKTVTVKKKKYTETYAVRTNYRKGGKKVEYWTPINKSKK